MLLDKQTSSKMSEAIRQLRELNIAFRQPSVHQLKVDLYNFYPSTGTIVLDGGTRHPARGLDAFIELVAKIRQPRSIRSRVIDPKPHDASTKACGFLVIDCNASS